MSSIPSSEVSCEIWGLSPRLFGSLLFTGGVVTAVAVKRLALYARQRCGVGSFWRFRWNESYRDCLGRFALKTESVGKAYSKEYSKLLHNFSQKARERWEPFGETLTRIPKEGWSDDEVEQFLGKLGALTNNPLQQLMLSGTAYTDGLEVYPLEKDPKCIGGEISEGLVEDQRVGARLGRHYTHAFRMAHLWNSLHHKEFAVGDWLSYQVVRMVADMFGGRPDEVHGFINSGGSESLMVAARSYVEWGIREKGHDPGESIIIAPASIHAALIKSAQAYKFRVKLVPVDQHGSVDFAELGKMVDSYGHQVVALFGSAPSYPTGQVDPIADMSDLAHRRGIGMHVDCCLGGWVINYLPEHDTDFLAFPGVTSLSADNHKNGQAPKGTSTLVTKNIGARNLSYFSVYAVPEWMGGLYGTAKDQGSQSCLPALHAFLSMVIIGKNGYEQTASQIHATGSRLQEMLLEFEHEGIRPFQILGDGKVNVIAFRIDHEAMDLDHGATYAFAEQMAKLGIVLNTIKGDAAHFCITPVSAKRAGIIKEFEKCARNALVAVVEINTSNRTSGVRFSGEAKMYCDLEAAMEPKKSNLSGKKKMEYT
jgi:glutamate/tyrosine decarboxylase-like PLP-dependent enzyme